MLRDRLVDRLVDRLRQRLFSPAVRAVGHLADHHRAPELVLAVCIILVWTIVAYLPLGATFLTIALVLMVILHYLAADTGRFSWLWLATGALLLCVIVASAGGGVLAGRGALLPAVGGSTALVYNECIRLNHLRRRDAVIGPSIYPAAAVAVGVSCLIGGGGVALAFGLVEGGTRPWFWLPIAALALFAVTVGLLVVPTRLAPHGSRQRWKPGARVPPAPTDAPDELR